MRLFFSILLILVTSITKYAEAKWIPNFFVPEEIPTILQLLYSRIPPTKIGSDQRFGIGFRLGKNADAQILIELGPQSETQPLGNANNGFSKRQSREGPADENKISTSISDVKSDQTKDLIYELNQTNSGNKKNTTRSESSYKIPANPFDSVGNLFMRWFRWLTQPKTDENSSFAQVDRTTKKGEEENEHDVNLRMPSKLENIK